MASQVAKRKRDQSLPSKVKASGKESEGDKHEEGQYVIAVRGVGSWGDFKRQATQVEESKGTTRRSKRRGGSEIVETQGQVSSVKEDECEEKNYQLKENLECTAVNPVSVEKDRESEEIIKKVEVSVEKNGELELRGINVSKELEAVKKYNYERELERTKTENGLVEIFWNLQGEMLSCRNAIKTEREQLDQDSAQINVFMEEFKLIQVRNKVLEEKARQLKFCVANLKTERSNDKAKITKLEKEFEDDKNLWKTHRAALKSEVKREQENYKNMEQLFMETSDGLGKAIELRKKSENKIKLLEEELKIHKDKLRTGDVSRNEEFITLKKKHTSLESSLSSSLECPVCFYVPTSGPVFQCPNGHLMCSPCRQHKCPTGRCPTCTLGMANIKSLVALAVIENIDHECSNDGCPDHLPLTHLASHKLVCAHRPVTCPAVRCQEEVGLAKLGHHLQFTCKNVIKVRRLQQDTVEVILQPISKTRSALDLFHMTWKNKVFLLTIKPEEGGCWWTFQVQLLGSREECAGLEVKLELREVEQAGLEGQPGSLGVRTFSGPPLPVEAGVEERRFAGLAVHMGGVVGRGEGVQLAITLTYSEN